LNNVGALLLLNQSKNYYPSTFSDIPQGYAGVVGRLTYDWNNRYMAEFNIGYNGSENFPPKKRYGFFPSGAIGWIVSEESFMQPLRRTISKLKLRASYGQTGNATLNGRRFAYLSTINDSWDDLKQYNWGTESGYNRNGMAEGEFAVPN
jgi:hypothetical protein